MPYARTLTIMILRSMTLIRIIKAPDFPTGGTIYGYSGVKEAYHTGRGRVIVRSENFRRNDTSRKREDHCA